MISVLLMLPETVLGGQKYMQNDRGWPMGRLKITEPKVHSEDHRGFRRAFIMYIINILIL